MKTETCDQVVRRIEAVASKVPGGAVAFDGDGTLWNGDVGEDYLHALLDRGDLREPARAVLAADAREFGIDPSGTAREVGARVFAAYLAGKFPEERVCEATAWLAAGWTRDLVTRFAEDVVRKTDVRSRLHPEAAGALSQVRRAGIEVFLVSASPRSVIEVAASLVGIDPAHVIAAEAVYDGDTMQPRAVRPIPYGSGKVAGLRAALGVRPLYAAFGDNAFDVAMLAEALVPVAVRAKPRLRDCAREVPGLVELAPG